MLRKNKDDKSSENQFNAQYDKSLSAYMHRRAGKSFQIQIS